MNQLFSSDGPIFTFLTKVADLAILNILWLICSLPIITLGASTTALYYVTLKMVRNEEDYIAKSFLRSFVQNFRQSTLVWLIMLAAGIFISVDFYAVLTLLEGNRVFLIVLFFVLLIYSFIMIYLFPNIARFENKTFAYLKNSLYMAIANLPYTLLMLAILTAALLASWWTVSTLLYSCAIWFIAGFALLAYINSFFLIRIFDKYSPREE